MENSIIREKAANIEWLEISFGKLDDARKMLFVDQEIYNFFLEKQRVNFKASFLCEVKNDQVVDVFKTNLNNGYIHESLKDTVCEYLTMSIQGKAPKFYKDSLDLFTSREEMVFPETFRVFKKTSEGINFLCDWYLTLTRFSKLVIPLCTYIFENESKRYVFELMYQDKKFKIRDNLWMTHFDTLESAWEYLKEKMNGISMEQIFIN
jgi:hypothetical protein